MRSTRAVEQREDPSIAWTPGRRRRPRTRGVVAAASYEARAVRHHSAMPMARARASVPARGLPRAALRRVRRREPRRDDHPALGDAARRTASRWTRRSSTCAGAALARRRAGDRASGAAQRVRDETGSTASVGVAIDEDARQDRERPRQARRPAGRRARDRARVPAPAAGRAALGRRPGDAAAPRQATGCGRSAIWPRCPKPRVVATLGTAAGPAPAHARVEPRRTRRSRRDRDRQVDRPRGDVRDTTVVDRARLEHEIVRMADRVAAPAARCGAASHARCS